MTAVVTAPPRLSVSTSTIEARHALDGLEDRWNELFDTGSFEPSVSFEWTASLLRHQLAPTEPVVVLQISRGASVEAIVPLVVGREKVFGCEVRTLTVASDGYNTHSDLLARDIDVEMGRVFFSALVDLDVRWDVFRLPNVLEGHPMVAVARALRREWPLSLYVRSADSPFVLDLPATFAEYLAQRSHKFRNHLRRTERKLEADATLRVSTVTDAAEVEAAYSSLLDIERASWKHEHGTAISVAPAQQPFFLDLCWRAAARGRLHLQFLWVGSQAVAYNLGYLSNGQYSYLKTSYRREYRDRGVATYLRARLIRDLIAAGVRRLDFPGPRYEWERQWTDASRGRQAISFYRPTVVGRIAAVAARAKHRLRPTTPYYSDPKSYRLTPGTDPTSGPNG